MVGSGSAGRSSASLPRSCALCNGRIARNQRHRRRAPAAVVSRRDVARGVRRGIGRWRRSPYALFARAPAVTIDAGYPILILAGLLVGVGTRYASGCTSGHGVCGLSRVSPRSIVATLTFMAAGFVTVYLVRHAFNL